MLFSMLLSPVDRKALRTILLSLVSAPCRSVSLIWCVRSGSAFLVQPSQTAPPLSPRTTLTTHPEKLLSRNNRRRCRPRVPAPPAPPVAPPCRLGRRGVLSQ